MKVVLVWVLAATALAVPTQSTAQQTSRGNAPKKDIWKMDFLKFAPGTFQMGCPPDRGDCGEDEFPVHEVRITQGFELARFEVTREQWIALMGPKCIDNDADIAEPVDCVSWNDTQKFIKKMNDKKDGYQYRLPTEAEWEYSAKSDTTYAINRDVFYEWVQDWYAKYPQGAQTDPKGPATGSMKVRRAGLPSASSRECALAGDRYDDAGFRLLRQPMKSR